MRFILGLIEQFPLISALTGSLLTYLINLEYLTLKTFPLERYKGLFNFLKRFQDLINFLKTWFDYIQKKQKELPPLVKDLISFIGIYLMVPLFEAIFFAITVLWKSLVSGKPSTGQFSIETIRVVGLIIIVIVAFLLFSLKKKSQLHYAYIELIVGVAMIKDALEMFNPDLKTFSLPDALKFFAAIYVIIRGFVNRDEAETEAQKVNS